MSSIRLSPKHGVNPSVTICYFCGADIGVALMGQLPGDAEAPRKCVVDMEPCTQCKEWMQQGVILIGVKAGEDAEMEEQKKDHQRQHGRDKPFIPNPNRTGGFAVLKDAAVRRMITDPELLASVLKARFCFIPEDVWKAVGLNEAANAS